MGTLLNSLAKPENPKTFSGMESDDFRCLAAFTQRERSGACGTELSENACAARHGSNYQKSWQGGTATVHERSPGKEPGKTRGIVEGRDWLIFWGSMQINRQEYSSQNKKNWN